MKAMKEFRFNSDLIIPKMFIAFFCAGMLLEIWSTVSDYMYPNLEPARVISFVHTTDNTFINTTAYDLEIIKFTVSEQNVEVFVFDDEPTESYPKDPVLKEVNWNQDMCDKCERTFYMNYTAGSKVKIQMDLTTNDKSSIYDTFGMDVRCLNDFGYFVLSRNHSNYGYETGVEFTASENIRCKIKTWKMNTSSDFQLKITFQHYPYIYAIPKFTESHDFAVDGPELAWNATMGKYLLFVKENGTAEESSIIFGRGRFKYPKQFDNDQLVVIGVVGLVIMLVFLAIGLIMLLNLKEEMFKQPKRLLLA